MTPLLHAIQLVEDVFSAEEIAEPVHNLTELANLEASVARLRTRWRTLTPLPDGERIRWAQAVRQLPNLAFLELDTDGLSTDADIIRVVLLGKDGSTLYAQTIQPRRPISEKITALTAVRPEEVEHAEIWPN